jgi:hypothetical protein
MDKLTEIEDGEARKDGPAKDFEDAMAKGDLQKHKKRSIDSRRRRKTKAR